MGRADYLISFNDPVGEVLKANPETGARCDVLDSWPLVYVVSSRIPEAQRVLDALNHGLHRVNTPMAAVEALSNRQSSLEHPDKNAE